MNLQFLGATDTVTGSKYLLDTGGARVLVDCGLFQGYKLLRLRNWAELPVDPATIDAVILTHAHIDHSGYLPVLVRNGFRGEVYCTEGTAELCGIMLPDSAHLAEEDAAYANRKGFSRHDPALPLTTVADAARALSRLRACKYGSRILVAPGVEVEFNRAGHIIGSAIVTLHIGGRRVVFSGDLGRQADLVMRAPEFIQKADVLLVESTYGDRIHPREDPLDALARIVEKTIGQGGSLIIPAFAVGRTQLLLYCLYRLREQGRLPDVPVFLNSPMAIEATRVFANHSEELRIDPETCAKVCAMASPVRTMEESVRINRVGKPKIILAGSGMATGGRVVHHIESYGQDPRSTILFTGFQAAGTRGASLVGGARELRVHGKLVTVHASVAQVEHLSAHADASELVTWMSGIAKIPGQTFIVHGEPSASDALRQRIERELHWPVTMPEYRQTYSLDGF